MKVVIHYLLTSNRVQKGVCKHSLFYLNLKIDLIMLDLYSNAKKVNKTKSLLKNDWAETVLKELGCKVKFVKANKHSYFLITHKQKTIKYRVYDDTWKNLRTQKTYFGFYNLIAFLNKSKKVIFHENFS